MKTKKAGTRTGHTCKSAQTAVDSGAETRRISRVVLEVRKYVSYMRIEFSDGSEAAVFGTSEQKKEKDTPTYGDGGAASSLSVAPGPGSPLFSPTTTTPIALSHSSLSSSLPQQRQQRRPDLSSSYKYKLLLQQQQRLGSSGGRVEIEYVLLRETLTLESNEVIVDVWGHTFPGTRLVSSLAFYTSKERIFGPYGVTEGEPFDYAAPDPACYLSGLRATAETYSGSGGGRRGPGAATTIAAAVLGNLEPTWRCGSARTYRPRVLAVAAKRIREINVFQESIAAYVSCSVAHKKVGARLAAELRLDTRRQQQQQQQRKSSSDSGCGCDEPWPAICAALVDEADLMAEDLCASCPQAVAADEAVGQGLACIGAFSRSLREIARAYEAGAALRRSSAIAAGSGGAGCPPRHERPRGVPRPAFYLVPEADTGAALAVEKGLNVPGARLITAPFRRRDQGQLFALTREGLILSPHSGMAVSAVVEAGQPFVPGVVAVMDEAATEHSTQHEDTATDTGIASSAAAVGLLLEHDAGLDEADLARQAFSYYTQDHTLRIGGTHGNPVLCLALGPPVPGTQGQRFVVLAEHTGALAQRWLLRR